MTSTSSSLNPDFPPTPPARAPRPFWKVRDPAKLTGTEAEALRMAFAADEAHLKALGWVNLIFAFNFAYSMGNFMMLAFRTAKGMILTPWAHTTYYIAVIRLHPILVMSATIAAFGLYRRRGWSTWAEFAFALTFAAFMGLTIGHDLWIGEAAEAVLTALGSLFYFLPMTILLRPGYSTVVSAEYEQAVQDTPYIRVRAKLPRALKIKLAALILIVTAALVAWGP